MAKTWGIPGKRQTFLSPGEQMQNKPKVPLNTNPLEPWNYKKSRYNRVDLYPKAQQGGVVPITSDIIPDVTPTPTPTITSTPTPTPLPCFESGTGFDGNATDLFINASDFLVAGSFLNYDGTSANRVISLNYNGSINGSFNYGTGFSAQPRDIEKDASGKFVFVGDFTSYNGTSSNRIIRLNSDGSVDGSFVIGTGFNTTVNTLVIQSDGKIIVGGAFATYSGISSTRIIRLNTDGSYDSSYTTGTGFNNSVSAIALQNDGKTIISGVFTAYDGTTLGRIVRLNTDGSYDSSFVTGAGFSSTVNSIKILPDGKILAVGLFSSYDGTSTGRLARLNSDGTLDTSLNIGTGFTSSPLWVEAQSDGKIIVAGTFLEFNGNIVNRIVRLNTDGSLDNTFNTGTGFNGATQTIDFLSDGRIVICGQFTEYNGVSANRIIVLNSDGSVADCPEPTPTPTATPTQTPTPTTTPTQTPTPT